MKKVSIIIPAYNVENYIERCILSCINQTFKDIEVIVVNDGSKDKTLEKIEYFKSIDNRIIVIDKINEGVCEARRAGFEIANGEYILFVDGDDWIKENAIEVLYKEAKKKNYDIVQYKWIEKKNENEYKSEMPQNIENKSLVELLLQCKITPSVWSKFIRKKFIEENDIKLPRNISYAEDLAFTCILSIYNPIFVIIDEHLYYYCRREGSLDSGINIHMLDTRKAILTIKKELKKNNLYKKYKEEFKYMAYIHCYYGKKEYIFRISNNQLSKAMFINWKRLRININSRNNRFYKKLYINDCKKALIVEEICKSSYCLGRLYYKFKMAN